MGADVVPDVAAASASCGTCETVAGAPDWVDCSVCPGVDFPCNQADKCSPGCGPECVQCAPKAEIPADETWVTSDPNHCRRCKSTAEAYCIYCEGPDCMQPAADVVPDVAAASASCGTCEAAAGAPDWVDCSVCPGVDFPCNQADKCSPGCGPECVQCAPKAEIPADETWVTSDPNHCRRCKSTAEAYCIYCEGPDCMQPAEWAETAAE